MAEETKIKKSVRLHGSVLFTTLAVMMVMLILMITTIALAGMASKKAYSTWFDNQTNYTAQNLVDNVVQSLRPGQANSALGAKIINSLSTKGASVTVDVKVNGDSYIPEYGRVNKLTFTYVGDNNSDYIIPGVANERIIKVSAEVEMGGEVSTYSTYVVGNKENKKTNAEGGGYIALADVKGGSGSNDAPSVIGRYYAGIDDVIDNTAFGNQAGNAGDILINANNVKFNSSTEGYSLIVGRNNPAENFYSGFRVTGNVKSENGLKMQSQYYAYKSDGTRNDLYSYIDFSKENLSNIPYFYVGGTLEFTSGVLQVDDGALNIYCGNLNLSANRKVLGNCNFFCTDPSKSSNVNFEGGSNLINWVDMNVNGAKADAAPPFADYSNSLKGMVSTGNFFSKGNVTIGGDAKDITLPNSLCVAGNLKVVAKLVVNGDVYVGKDLEVTNNLTVNGNLYVGGTKTGNVTVSGGTEYTEKYTTIEKALEAKNSSLKSFYDEAFAEQKALGGDTVDVFQTVDNVKSRFKKNDGSYSNVVEESDYKGIKIWDGTSTITESCIWSKAGNNNIGQATSQTININPGTNEIWINIAPDLETISTKTIIIDDSQGGSVKFFIEKRPSNKLEFKMTKIVTKTYYDMLVAGTTPMVPLSTYPDSKYVPHVYIYAASDNKVNIYMGDGNYLYTGDIVAPAATFKCGSSNGISKNIEYTLQRYQDTNNDGIIDGKFDSVKVEKSGDIMLIGSIEAGTIDATNQFRYLYVDDPPTDGGAPTVGGGYRWNTLDGYSTY